MFELTAFIDFFNLATVKDSFRLEARVCIDAISGVLSKSVIAAPIPLCGCTFVGIGVIILSAPTLGLGEMSDYISTTDGHKIQNTIDVVLTMPLSGGQCGYLGQPLEAHEKAHLHRRHPSPSS